MSLLIANGVITIQNSSNITKFTSNDKLTYLKYSQTASVNVSGDYPNHESFYSLGSNDFLVLTLCINSTNGNAIPSYILGKFIPANGSILLNIDGRSEPNAAVGPRAACSTDVLSAALTGSYLTFKINQNNIYYAVRHSTITANLTYRAKIFGYL